jgi:hypothetical protein
VGASARPAAAPSAGATKPAAGNASATAAAPLPTPAAGGGGFSLSPALAAGAAATRPQLAPLDAANTTTKGPEPVIFSTPGATQTILIGCTLPLSGDHELGGRAIMQAAQMAINDTLPALKLGVNVNLTCLNSRVGRGCAVALRGAAGCAVLRPWPCVALTHCRACPHCAAVAFTAARSAWRFLHT